MSYDHKNRTPDGLASQIIKSMLEDLNHLHCQNGCLVGSGGGSVGYLAHGTSTDYMYDIIKVPMSFTFEVRTFKGHTNEKNFVGLTVNNECMACGSETNEVFVYLKAISKLAAWHRFSSSDMDDTDGDAASYK